MRIFKLSIALFAIAFSLFSCAGPSPAVVNTPANTPANTIASGNVPARNGPSLQQLTGDLSEARKTYTEVCAKCHQPNGQGGEIPIEGKSVRVPDFKRPGIVNAPDADLAKTITN